jgi:division protein CdvB (Snf7/Vps24/ESCRT-III family)
MQERIKKKQNGERLHDVKSRIQNRRKEIHNKVMKEPV